MIVTSLNELYFKIKEDLSNKEASLYIADRKNNTSELEELLVQKIERVINLNTVSFLAIRNIVVREQFRSKGNLKKFIFQLEELKINLIFHDFINPSFYLFLKKNNYIELIEKKAGAKIISMYKIFNA